MNLLSLFIQCIVKYLMELTKILSFTMSFFLQRSTRKYIFLKKWQFNFMKIWIKKNKDLLQKKLIVLRGETGILPEYRRNHNVITVIIKEGVMSKLLYFFREVYVLGCFVHPIVYYSIAKNAYRIYPNHRYKTPQKINSLMFELAKEFHLKEICSTV